MGVGLSEIMIKTGIVWLVCQLLLCRTGRETSYLPLNNFVLHLQEGEYLEQNFTLQQQKEHHLFSLYFPKVEYLHLVEVFVVIV